MPLRRRLPRRRARRRLCLSVEELAGVAASFGRRGPVHRLGEGMDFVAYRCDDLVLRVPKREEVAVLVDAEHALLRALDPGLPLAVPRPLSAPIRLPSSGRPVLVYPAVPGTPLGAIDNNPNNNASNNNTDNNNPSNNRGNTALDVAGPLGRFLRALHAMGPVDVAPQSIGALSAYASEKLPLLGAHLDGDLLDAARDALRHELPRLDDHLVMCHRDLTEDHVLVDLEAGRVCGVIDFGDAGPSPWWHDLVGIWLWGGDDALLATCDAYGRALLPDERRHLEQHALAVTLTDAYHAMPGAEAPGTAGGHGELEHAMAVVRRVLHR